jgi:hypothetical protein
MTDQELGNLDVIKTDEGGRYVVPESPEMHPLGKLYLESQPIASRYGLVGTGTTCYRVRRPDSGQWDYVLKFKWRWARDRPEDELLKLAKKKCVCGAVSLDHYQEIESTANLRRSLRWGPQRRFTRMYLHKGDASAEEQMQKVAPNADDFIQHTEETDNYFQNRILPVRLLLLLADLFILFSLSLNCLKCSVMLLSVTNHFTMTPRIFIKTYPRET